MCPVSRRYVPEALDNPQGTYGLEHDIEFRSELLQTRNVVEGSKNCLESQFLEGFGLFCRAKLDSDIVLGPLGMLDEMGEDSASYVTWSIVARVSDKHLPPSRKTPQMVRRPAYQ